MKNKTPVSLYELIVKGLKEAIENEKIKARKYWWHTSVGTRNQKLLNDNDQ